MTKQQRLRLLITMLPRETWGDKVRLAAKVAGRSESTIYNYLTKRPIPDATLDSFEYRIRLGRF